MITRPPQPAVPEFSYRDGALQAEGLPLELIAERVGTPFFLYSASAMEAAYHRFTDADGGDYTLRARLVGHDGQTLATATRPELRSNRAIVLVSGNTGAAGTAALSPVAATRPDPTSRLMTS